ncbi:uncharacterized protein [Panulirus ornatus]|uniref:uncharacterized protein n=1 Tax=Panulirus ornatus TaxID=150431 RepID=UPI003A869AD3
MRRAVLILVGLAVVASLPTPEGPRSRAELLQLILSASPEENHISDNENIETEEDVLTGQNQIYVLPSFQVQEPTVVQLSKPVQGNANDAGQPDQAHSEPEPQQEDADAPKEDEQEQVPEMEQAKTEPEVEQTKTEPEVEQIQDQSNPELKEADTPNLEKEHIIPPELVEQINKQQIPENEHENVPPEAEVDAPPAPEAEQVPLEPYVFQPTTSEEAEGDAGIVVVGQEDREIEPYLVDRPQPVMLEFPEAFEPQEYPATQKEMTDLFRLFMPKFSQEENEEPEVDVLEELPPSGPYFDFDIMTEPEYGTQIDEYSAEMPVINDASGKPEDVNPDIPVEEVNEENPKFNTPDIVPEGPVLLNGENVVMEENVALYITNPVLQGTDSNNPTEVEGPSYEPPIQGNVSHVAFFIPSHETPIYDDTDDETPFELAPREELFHDQAPEEEFFNVDTPTVELFQVDAPEREFFHKEAPREDFFHEEAPREEFFHEEAPKEEFFHEVPQEEFYDEVPEGEFYSDEVGEALPINEHLVIEEMSSEFGSDIFEEAAAPAILPEEVSKDIVYTPEGVIPQTTLTVFDEGPKADYFVPEEDGPIGEYGEFQESVSNMGEPFFITKGQEPPSNFDSDAVDIFVIDGPQQNSEATSAVTIPLAVEQVFTEEQPVPIAEYLEQPVPLVEYPEETYHIPIIVQGRPYRIPSNYNNDRIIFPDTEPPRSLPIFPHQWDEDSHSKPLKEQHMPQTEDTPSTLPVQPEEPQDIPDFTNLGIPRVPISKAVPLFKPNQERDGTNSETYVGPTVFQENFQVPLSSQQNLKHYNTIRRTPAEYTFPQHTRRPVNFPEHFHGPSSFPQHFHEPSSFPQHFHGPVSHTHPFRPEIFSYMPTSDFNVFDGPVTAQNMDTKDFHPQFPTGPKSLIHEPITRFEPFFGPSGEPPLREHSPLLRTSSIPVTFDRLNQHEPQLNIDIYPKEMPFTHDVSFDPAFNFPDRPYFRTQHSPSYGDPVYAGPVMYPATGLYPPTRTYSRYAPNFVAQQNNPNPSNPYPTPTW